MYNLLAADITRMQKQKVLWLGSAILFVWSFVLLYARHRMTMLHPEYLYTIDDIFYQYGPLIGVLCAGVTSLFIGADYSDGTIRNKIVAGHSRYAVYLANWIINLLAGLVMMAAWLLPMLTAGNLWLDWSAEGASMVIPCLLATVFIVAAFSAIFTCTGMLCQNKATSVIVAFAVFLLLILVSSYCQNSLSQPETTTPMIMTVNGLDISEPVPNPNYVSGALRSLLTFGMELLPTGQGILLLTLKTAHVWWMPLYSLLVIAVTTAAGMALFRKKDIR